MLEYDVFKKAWVLPDDIPFIMEIDKIYGDKVEEIANNYKKSHKTIDFIAFLCYHTKVIK